MVPLALGIGLILGWWLAGRKARVEEARMESELRRQLAAREQERDDARRAESAAQAERASALTARELAERQETESRRRAATMEAEREELRRQLSERTAELAAFRADLDAARRLLEERQALYETSARETREAHEKALADLREAFKALSADALKENGPQFLRLAQETFGKLQEAAKGDLQQRQEAIAGLLKPLETNLKTYQERLQQSESSQTRMLGEVRKQLEALGQQSLALAGETERFRMVLKSNQARGRWGEETLRRVVEAAGLSVHCDFIEQATDGDKKPDMIVRLPGDRVIIIDAKVPDLDVITALEAADVTKRTQLLEAHAAKLKETIRDLAKRDYPAQFKNALDHVVMFLPAESLFSAALEGDRDLILWAANQRIMLATPASLIALLRSVSISWQQHAQTENARAISEAAQELFARVVKFTEHFERIRAGLARANEAYNDAVGSYERMVRPSGERLTKLGLPAGGKELAAIAPADASLRLPPGADPG